MSLSQPLAKKKSPKHYSSSAALPRRTALFVSRVRKLTHLTEDAPTSKVHARMTQPTFIFAREKKYRKKEEKEEFFFFFFFAK